MAGDKRITRESRTRRDIKRALTELLSKKALDDITMSELAREAEVSRSTLYQHYANVHEAYTDTVLDFDKITAPVMTQLECYEGIEPPGTFPFCSLLREPENYEHVVNDPRFLDTFIGGRSVLEDHVFFQSLVDAGYTREVARALAVFQINGCFKAVKAYGADEATWREVRDAIDTFICGGLSACREKKYHQLRGKMESRKRA